MLRMTDLHMPTLRQAAADDWSDIHALLSDNGLPIEDLGANALDSFLVAEDDGDLVGLIGLQVFGTTGLLRSLVVAETARRVGLGGKLVGALESAAQTAGIRDLWLLTIDAERFFERQGFEIVDRDAAPQSIRSTEEFGGLCPDSAHLMTKSLPR
jgi:amino-acid N-acetyltransferase